ncbi:hypothetical protein ACFU6I_31580 [Streptomyces sp. NPDC057486]|uniref:hypothetical protein n=1 Tax=Streptomyces sp. NPDC057486 TaxID=3346145 RepID=UPI0036CD1590
MLPVLEIVDSRIGDTGEGGAVVWRTPLRRNRRGPGRSTAPCALGAGAGNSPTESLVPVLEQMGVPTGVDTQKVPAVAEGVARPFVPRLPYTDRAAITQRYAGVHSGFLLHAQRAGARYDGAAHEILRKVSEAGCVGGQEDMITDVALQLVAERERGATHI